MSIQGVTQKTLSLFWGRISLLRTPSALTFAVILWTTVLCALEREVIAVMELGSSGVPGAHIVVLSERLRTELHLGGEFDIVPSARIYEVLLAQEPRLKECSSPSCAVEVGSVIGVKRIVVGNVSLNDSGYAIKANLVDVATGTIVKHAEAACEDCEMEMLLTETIPAVAEGLTTTILTEDNELMPVNSYGRKDFRRKRKMQRAFKNASIPLLIAGYVILGAGVITNLTAYLMYNQSEDYPEEDTDQGQIESIVGLSCIGGGLVLVIPGHIFSSRSKKLKQELEKRKPVGR